MRRRRTPKFTSDLHYAVSGGDSFHRAANQPETYEEAVEYLASAPKDVFLEAFDSAVAAREGGWLVVEQSAEASREEAENRRHGVRAQKPAAEPAPEPISNVPRPRSRADHDRAEQAARIYAMKLQTDAIQRRAALVPPVSEEAMADFRQAIRANLGERS